MAEGQLQKQLRKVFVDRLGVEGVMVIKPVSKIVEDAKKACPPDILLALRNVVHASNKEEMKFTLSSADCKRWLEWFVEQFGAP